MSDPDLPLVVDLDGTLVRDDTLLVMVNDLARRAPARAAGSLLHLVRGRAHLKSALWRRAPLDVVSLKWHPPLVERLSVEAAAGRTIVLATGAPQGLADEIARALPLFDRTIGSSDTVNLTSHRKAAVLVALFGWRGFVYAGNSTADLPVWEAAAGAWVCNAPSSLLAQASARTNVIAVL